VDVLRAAIVLLHASLEDVVRSASERLLPHSERKVLDEIGFPDGPEKTKPKFSLGDLHVFKGQTVDYVIQAAVSTSLQRSNYNSVAEIAGPWSGSESSRRTCSNRIRRLSKRSSSAATSSCIARTRSRPFSADGVVD
jgi:hypothetical protein